MGRVLKEWQRGGQPDLEAGEMAVRDTIHQLGGLLLEKLLGGDGGATKEPGSTADKGTRRSLRATGTSSW